MSGPQFRNHLLKMTKAIVHGGIVHGGFDRTRASTCRATNTPTIASACTRARAYTRAPTRAPTRFVFLYSFFCLTRRLLFALWPRFVPFVRISFRHCRADVGNLYMGSKTRARPRAAGLEPQLKQRKKKKKKKKKQNKKIIRRRTATPGQINSELRTTEQLHRRTTTTARRHFVISNVRILEQPLPLPLLPSSPLLIQHVPHILIRMLIAAFTGAASFGVVYTSRFGLTFAVQPK